jgi:hypothetical protein
LYWLIRMIWSFLLAYDMVGEKAAQVLGIALAIK